MKALPVAVVAATGRLGRVVVRQLLDNGVEVIAIGRDPVKLAALPSSVICRVGDMTRPETIKGALRGVTIIVTCMNAEHVPTLLNNLSDGVERLVIMGSTRRFSKVPDATALAVHRAEEALSKLAIPSVILLSTMIYGGGGSVIDAWARSVQRYPALPVPWGEKSRIQPIHIEDVARSIVAATQTERATGNPIIIAGAESLSYREMVRRIAAVLNRSVLLIPIPAGLIEKAAFILNALPHFTRHTEAAARLFEDRSFDLATMRDRLGINPRPLDLGFLAAKAR